jgi:hypothetical protein
MLTKTHRMANLRVILLKVVSRYLSKKEYDSFFDELAGFKRLGNTKFVEIMKKHFDMERWSIAPLIKQDLWLYNYFTYEYKGTLKRKGLLAKYIHHAFIYDDAEFFKSAADLNKEKTPLPKGVKFIPGEELPESINHRFSQSIEPKTPH